MVINCICSLLISHLVNPVSIFTQSSVLLLINEVSHFIKEDFICSDSDEEKSRLAEAAVSFNFIAENASKLADAVVKNEVNSENVTEKLQLHLEEQKKGDDKIPKKKRIKVKNNDGKDGEFSKQELNPTPISNRRNITVLNEQVIKIEDKLRKHKKKKRKKEK